MRLFVAVWPPAAVSEQLDAIDRPPRPGIRWTTREQWHVTLRFFGEVAPDELERVKGALEHLSPLGCREAITAFAGPTLERIGPAVLCLPVAGLDDLAAKVVAVTSGIGKPVQDRPFRGHLTIARAARGVNPRPPVPVRFASSWEVDEVTLVASTLHPAGARYQVIGRYGVGASLPPDC